MTWVNIRTDITVIWSYGRHVVGPRRVVEDPDRYGQADATTDSKLTKASRQRDALLKASTLPCLVLVRDIVLIKAMNVILI